jgi:hypothetical protein
MWLINFIRKRPSDTTIRVWRILFWLLLAWTAYYNLIYQWDAMENSFWGLEISNQTALVLKYILIWIAFVPVIVSILNKCVAKSKYIRIAQIVFWIVLFIYAGLIKDTPDLDFDVLVVFLWFLPLVAGITGKCIPKPCLRFGEKITKIRV